MTTETEKEQKIILGYLAITDLNTLIETSKNKEISDDTLYFYLGRSVFNYHKMNFCNIEIDELAISLIKEIRNNLLKLKGVQNESSSSN